MSADYTEPQLTVAVLDFLKPSEARECLESIRRHVKVAHRVVYCHNGPADYAISLYHDGLIDLFMQSRVNAGLGVGTRDLMSVIHTPYTLYLQNDQELIADIDETYFQYVIGMIGRKMMLKIKDEPDPQDSGWIVASVSLAGQICGPSIYSERAHIIPTAFYRALEREGVLPLFGAGPYHHGEWREAAIQRYYEANKLIHAVHLDPIVRDRGVWTLRSVGGGRVRMRTDTKAVWWEETPTERYVFPEHTDAEWAEVLAGRWPAGKIPQLYLDRNQSFNHWGEQKTPPSS